MSPALPFIRPSGAATWVVCSGYAAMRAAYPEAPDEADDEVREDGVACHWLAKEIHEGRTHALDSLSPNKRLLTEEMFDAVDLYLDTLRAWGTPLVVEQPVDCSYLLSDTYSIIGTPDAWSFDPATYTLRIADLKFGYRFVEVWYNWQIICYVAALIRYLHLDDLRLTVEAYIVQPRSYHRDGPVRTWRFKGHEIRAYVNTLIGKAHDAIKPEALCTPNPGCLDCPGRHACMALQNSAYGSLEVSYKGVPLELLPQEAANELAVLNEASKRLNARIDGLTQQLEHALRNGKQVIGYSLEPTFARERWRDGTESQVLRLGSYFNVDLAQPVRPVSPAQAKKLLPSSVVAAMAYKPSTGVKLVRTDPLEARKKFSKQS